MMVTFSREHQHLPTMTIKTALAAGEYPEFLHLLQKHARHSQESNHCPYKASNQGKNRTSVMPFDIRNLCTYPRKAFHVT